MITKADDYPIHQTPDPIAVSYNRNQYDRYFFNGFRADGSLAFAVAFGVYPHLGVMDGAFAVSIDGMQHNVRVSRHLVDAERMDTTVGPLSVEVVEPLKVVRVRLGGNEGGIEADLTFTGRLAPMEEPRQRMIHDGKCHMDITRMTQSGSWQGWISVHGRRIEVRPDTVSGVRDRSWGIKAIGQPRQLKDTFWLWTPLQAEDRDLHFYAIERPDGTRSVLGAQMAMLAGGKAEHMADAWADLTYRPGTAEVARATIHMIRQRGQGEITVRLTTAGAGRLFLSGVGYQHQEWGHGFDKGASAFSHDTIQAAGLVVTNMPRHIHDMHFQVPVSAEVTLPDGVTLAASGVLEQMIAGTHAPSGLKPD